MLSRGPWARFTVGRLSQAAGQEGGHAGPDVVCGTPAKSSWMDWAALEVHGGCAKAVQGGIESKSWTIKNMDHEDVIEMAHCHHAVGVGICDVIAELCHEAAKVLPGVDKVTECRGEISSF